MSPNFEQNANIKLVNIAFCTESMDHVLNCQNLNSPNAFFANSPNIHCNACQIYPLYHTHHSVSASQLNYKQVLTDGLSNFTTEQCSSPLTHWSEQLHTDVGELLLQVHHSSQYEGGDCPVTYGELHSPAGIVTSSLTSIIPLEKWENQRENVCCSLHRTQLPTASCCAPGWRYDGIEPPCPATTYNMSSHHSWMLPYHCSPSSLVPLALSIEGTMTQFVQHYCDNIHRTHNRHSCTCSPLQHSPLSLSSVDSLAFTFPPHIQDLSSRCSEPFDRFVPCWIFWTMFLLLHGAPVFSTGIGTSWSTTHLQ